MSNNELLERALTSVGLAEGQHFWLKAGTALDQCFGNRLRIGESYVNGVF
jgi:hypothetical protein